MKQIPHPAPQAFLQRTRHFLSDLYIHFLISETVVMVTLALFVGLGAGFSAVALRRLIDLAHHFFFGTLGQWLSFMGTYYIIILPALGGLLVGILITFLAPEARGAGVGNVMEAIAGYGGRIRPLVAVVKPVATALCLGSSGSAGREGPIVQTGAAIGSSLGQVLHLSDERTKRLAAYGVAGGIAATFNAPLTGAIFALEILLTEFGLMQFSGVVVSSVTASVIGHAYFGNVPAFSLPTSYYNPIAAGELPIYGLLGVMAAFVGVGFTHTFYKIDHLFQSWSTPSYLKPMIGGLLVGVIGFWFPQLFGVGYETIENVLSGRFSLNLIVVLGTLKILTTGLTIGSGSSGGVFAPLLFVGALLGGLFEHIVAPWLPTSASTSSPYVLVGMAAVFGAANRAPITAILTLFEMSRGYHVILPLMFSTVISATIAHNLYDQSIYTVNLEHHEIDIRHLRGMLRRGDIIQAYSHTHLDEQARLAAQIVEITLRNHHYATGKTLKKLNLPSDCLIASIRRGNQILIPRGETRLEAGDVIVALTADENQTALRTHLTHGEENDF